MKPSPPPPDPHRRRRGRLNATILTLLDGVMNRVYGDLKRRLLVDLPETVVEIGPGGGANLRYYSRGTKLIGVEPNPWSQHLLRERAARRGIGLEIFPHGAESLDLEDATADLVVSTLVLCSVDDPAAVLSEVRRVLKPEGRFVFIEHVAAPPGTWTRSGQDLLCRPWRWLFDGCHLNRDTGSYLEAAGFSSLDVKPFRVLPDPLPIARHIAGLAVR